MSMQSRGTNSFDSENFSILRLRKKVSSNNSYIGGIITNRNNLDASNQISYGLDGIINVFKNDYLQINFANTNNSEDSQTYDHFLQDRKRLFLMWENRSQVGLNYRLSYSQADKDYAPAMGFEARTNFKSFGDQIGYGWFVKDRKNLRYIRIDLQTKAFLTSSTNELESFLVSPMVNIQWNKANAVIFTYNYLYDDVPSSFNLSEDIEILASQYTNTDFTISYATPPVNLLQSAFEGTIGTFYGGDRVSIGITPVYVISKYLTLGGFYQYNRISFDQDLYNAHIGRIKLSASLNVHLSLSAFVQVNSLAKTNAMNIRLRYNRKDGTDLYIVYNETLNNNGRMNSFIPYSDYRGITLKFIHTFLF